jgi:hypothetical protein
MPCGTAMVCMPSCTTPMFSKMPVTSQLTQPATLAIVQASGSAVATVPASIWPWPHSVMPMPAVLTSSSAFRAESVVMKRVMSRMWARMAPVWSSMTSRTYRSSSRVRAKSFTVRMLV